MKQTHFLVISLCLDIFFLVQYIFGCPTNYLEPHFYLPNMVQGFGFCPHMSETQTSWLPRSPNVPQAELGLELAPPHHFWCLEVSPVFLRAW